MGALVIGVVKYFEYYPCKEALVSEQSTQKILGILIYHEINVT